MTSNHNNIESLIGEKLGNFETAFSADEIAADWNAVSAKAGITAESGGQAAQISQSFSRAFWLKLTGVLLIAVTATLFFWPNEQIQETNEPANLAINQPQLNSNSNNGAFVNELDDEKHEDELHAQIIEKAENKLEEISNDQPSKSDEMRLAVAPSNNNPIVPITDPLEVKNDEGGKQENILPNTSVNLDFQWADFTINNELETSEFTFCQGEAVVLNRWAADPNGVYRVLVKEPGLKNYLSYGRISHNNVIKLSLDKPGEYRVAFEKKIGNNWVEAKNQEKMIEVLPKPVARFSMSNAASNVYMFTNQSQNAKTQEWRIGSYGTGEPNPVRAFANAGTESVTLIASNNQCHDTLVKTIKVEAPIIDSKSAEMPNFFAPDATTNKFFELPLPADDKIIAYHLEIRSLESNNLVFESFNSNHHWNGNDLAGKACRKGKYYYIIKYAVEGNSQQATTKGGLIHLYR